MGSVEGPLGSVGGPLGVRWGLLVGSVDWVRWLSHWGSIGGPFELFFNDSLTRVSFNTQSFQSYVQ